MAAPATSIIPTSDATVAATSRRPVVGWGIVLGVALVWVFWPTFEQMVFRWSQDPQYTHGYVVPLFAAIVLWTRRDSFPTGQLTTSWWGVAALLAAAILRVVGVLFSYEWVEAGSLLPAVAGLLLLAGGPALLRWAWPVFAFLLFVLPWPWQFDMALAKPLRRVATVCSTYLLQTIGYPALARGNIISIDDLQVGVIDACSGLGMLMAFFALSTAVALVIDRPLFDRIVLFVSAIPVGILMNVIRVSVTVVLFQVASSEMARFIFHDVAGWVMMPMALGVMGLELWWLKQLRLGPADRSAASTSPPLPTAHSPTDTTLLGATGRLSATPDATTGSLLETPDAAS